MDAVTLYFEPLLGDRHGAHDMVITTMWEPPPGGQEDLYRELDIWAAREMQATLLGAYPGHPWCCQHDSFQGIAKLGIPILMGVTNWMVINLRKNRVSDDLVREMGGEILERYGLPRGRFELGSFLQARELLSALVIRSRRVPG